jgi:hypothetical protein
MKKQVPIIFLTNYHNFIKIQLKEWYEIKRKFTPYFDFNYIKKLFFLQVLLSL